MPEDPLVAEHKRTRKGRSEPDRILSAGAGRTGKVRAARPPADRRAPVGSGAGGVGEWPAPSARAGSRTTPRQVVPDHRESCVAAAGGGNR